MNSDRSYESVEHREEELRIDPAVSVVMPAYKTAPYIGEALASVFRQTFRDFEVIVVNDGSPDTEDLERVLEPYLDRIVYIKQDNRGVSAARNTGIRAARAPFVAMLDSDDAWEPEYLEAQLAILRESATIAVVYPNAIYFGDCAEAGREFMELCPSEGEVTLESLVRQRCTVMSSVMCRRKIIMDAGLFDETLRSAEDFDLWLRIVMRGGRIVYQRRPLVRYRRRDGSFMADMVEHTNQVLRVVDKTRDNPAITLRQRKALERARTGWCAALRFHEGKRSFSRGDVASAVEAWVEANRIIGSRRLAWKLWCLRLLPGPAVIVYRAWCRIRTRGEAIAARRVT